MLRRVLGNLFQTRAVVSWLLFLPTAAAIVYLGSSLTLRDAASGLPDRSLAGQVKAETTDTPSSPTSASEPPTDGPLPTLELILPTLIGPEMANEAVPTQVRSGTTRLPAPTIAVVAPAPDIPVSNPPQEPPPPPPQPTAVPPPADTAPPPPANTAPPPPPPLPTEAPPVLLDIVICHMPGGDPSKAETKTVSPDALLSHLAHGDTLGPCP